MQIVGDEPGIESVANDGMHRDRGGQGDEPRRRSRWWLVALVALAGTAAGGWVVGSRMQSPEQAAANVTAPAPSWITATVERRVLSQTVISRGDVRPQVTVAVGVPASVEGSAIVTNVAVGIGDEVAEGTRLVEVSGRPVFVLAGEVPVYRSLRPGMSGADVAQLQAALARLGFEPDTDGRYGDATKAAVAAFYEQAGYEPMPSSSTEATERASAEQAMSDADAAIASAQAALDAAQAGQAGSAIAQAEAARNQAERALGQAEAERVSQVALAEQSVGLAAAERDRVAADPEAAPGALDQAQFTLNEAQASLDQTRRSADDAVAVAKEALWVATLARDEARFSAVSAEAQATLDAAIASHARAQATLDAVRAASGPTVAQGEIVFAPTLPARVQQTASTLGPVASGDPPGNPSELAALAVGDLVVSMSLRPGEVGLVRVGMAVELLDERSTTSYPATVAEVSDSTGIGTDGQLGVPLVITPDEPLPDTLGGANLRVTITAASTEVANLVVPLAAVSSAADGSTYVSVRPPGAASDSDPIVVEVTTGLSADGFVAVEPATAGALDGGDRVVVGR